MTNTLIPAADQYQIPNQPMLTHETYQAQPSVVAESFADRGLNLGEVSHEVLTADAHAAALTGRDLMVGRTRPDNEAYVDYLTSDEQMARIEAHANNPTEKLVHASPEYFTEITHMGRLIEDLRERAEAGVIKVTVE